MAACSSAPRRLARWIRTPPSHCNAPGIHAVGGAREAARGAAFSRRARRPLRFRVVTLNWLNSNPARGASSTPPQASTTTPAPMPTPMAMQMPMPSLPFPTPSPHTRTPFTEEPPAPVPALRRSRRGPSARIGAKTMAGAVGPVAAAKAAAAAAVLETADGAEPSARGPATILRRRRTFATAAKSAAIGSTTGPTLKKGRPPPGRVRP